MSRHGGSSHRLPGFVRRLVNRLTERPPRLYRVLFPSALFRMKGAGKRIAVTFDDGPVPEATPEILAILEGEGVKGTFFMVGDNVRKYPSVARSVRDAGHSFGSHTFHHIRGDRASVEGYLADVDLGNRMIRDTIGETSLFRPPHGRLKCGQMRGLRKRGLRMVMFDLVSRDYDPDQTPAELKATVLGKVRPGSVIVFHDSVKTISKLRIVLPDILRSLREAGYVFVTLPMGAEKTEMKD